jgi:hypothetical protein
MAGGKVAVDVDQRLSLRQIDRVCFRKFSFAVTIVPSGLKLNHRLRLANCSTCAGAACATELLRENISKFPFVPGKMKTRGR